MPFQYASLKVADFQITQVYQQPDGTWGEQYVAHGMYQQTITRYLVGATQRWELTVVRQGSLDAEERRLSTGEVLYDEQLHLIELASAQGWMLINLPKQDGDPLLFRREIIA